MTALEIAALVFAAIIAGGMNAIAGGGTLVTFPVLLAFGIPAIQANATSTLALMVGIVGSAYGYREHLVAAKRGTMRFGPVSIVGGLLGALLLTATSEKAFAQLVPFLILFATVLFMAQNLFRRLVAIEANATSQGASFGIWAVLLQFFVAVYGGYFGAGIGILMLAVFGLMGLHHIHEMNALKTILAGLINLVATTYFVYAGLIRWPEAIVMTCGAGVGYYLGAHFTQKIPPQRVRQLITVIGISISAVMFWEQFLKH